jgi:hypothetical protein
MLVLEEQRMNAKRVRPSYSKQMPGKKEEEKAASWPRRRIVVVVSLKMRFS